MVLLVLLFVGTAFSACPAGSYYIAHRDKCTTIVANGTRYGFFQSEVSCIDMGGHLASISNIIDNAILFALAKGELLEGNAFIGVNLKSGTWRWSDKSAMNFTNWAQGNPVDGDECATLNLYDTKWYSADCSQRNLPFFCELPPGAKKSVCPDSWTLLNGKCYKFSDNYPRNVTWKGARYECKLLGGDLASISNAEENKVLKALTPNVCSYNHKVWIGFQNADTYEWSDTSPTTYSNIDRSVGYANYAKGVYYMYANCHKQAGLWAVDSDTATTSAFLCQRPTVQQCHVTYVPPV